MATTDYRIESNQPLSGGLLPAGRGHYLVRDRGLAVALAAKAARGPATQEVRVVHVPTGEIVFRKTAERAAADGLDA
ncbi:hypothetical protein [Ramlibacter tataouinensis]|uniref:Uncharacterized protein n=1 Tax=Ramlibacter tataouinensis (strain ATCC BAA-407 / DSM 14655 / LMG 21543 / TTB310) TaxID=365046 RepID=F5XZF9_RAMTT|nr:hypothetical protein [Ramlibacter tataouinensis]AEG94516.1 hypothetical protein Rta_34030 [Ramlibacter tataouinensis TTB310]